MRTRKILIMAAVTLLFIGCKGNNENKADDPLAASGRTQRTENLLTNLKEQAKKGYMYGHQDDPVYGVGWVGDENRSDVKSVCNDYPAVMGFDLGHLELGDSVNLDGVPFSRMRKEIINQFERGGVVTLSWHLDNPLTGGTAWVNGGEKAEQEKQTVASVLEGGENHEIFLTWIDRVADFLNSLQTSYGVKVPVLFRPWHEHTGSWFWWGQNLCSIEQYKALWVLTENRLKEDGVTNALFAYSPGSEYWEHEEMYLERYPGDEYIDVIGFDHYCTAQEGDTLGLKKYTEQLEILLTTLCCVAEKHGKVPAITETGYESVKCDNWWTTFLQPACDKFPIAYVLTWRNAHDKPGHLYAPYPGQQSAEDFVAFYNADKTLFVQDLNGLYLEKTSKAEE